MTQVNLPRTNQTGPNEWSDVEANDAALQAVINGQLGNDNIEASAGIVATKLAGEIPRSKLAADAKPVTWYTPKVIATEQTRESTSFGTLTTADEIKAVVVPANGLIQLGYLCKVKASVPGAGRIAIFLNETQLRDANAAFLETSTGNGLRALSTSQKTGLVLGEEVSITSEVPYLLNAGSGAGGGGDGAIEIVVPGGGTFTVSVRYRATSGSVTAKDRALWCCVLGS